MQTAHIQDLADLQSNDWNLAVTAADRLATAKHSLPHLLPLLNSAQSTTRNATAIALRQIANDQAVPYIVEAIKRLNSKDCGTLVWALETHDCSNYFLFLFELALNDIFEIQNHALLILYQQKFWYDTKDLDIAQRLLIQYQNNHKHIPETTDFINDLHLLLTDLRNQIT